MSEPQTVKGARAVLRILDEAEAMGLETEEIPSDVWGLLIEVLSDAEVLDANAFMAFVWNAQPPEGEIH